MTAQSLKAKTAFLIPVLMYILAGIVFLSLYRKAEIHLYLNSLHSPFGDWLFKWGTYAGDGWVFLPALFPVLLAKRKFLLGYLLAALLTLFSVAGLKNYFKEPRPARYFEGETELHLVQDVKMHYARSFPSGHTTTAFVCFGYLAFLSPRAGLQLALALLSLMVAYSRIYLSQHFLADTVAGAALGTGIALLTYLWARSMRFAWGQGYFFKAKA